jgi:hypothetical protein
MARGAPKVEPDRHYLAKRTVSLSDGTVLHVAERRAGIDPWCRGTPPSS